MASAAFLAGTVWLLMVRLSPRRVATAIIAPSAMLILAAMQGFIRADLAIAVHLGIFLVCLMSAGSGFVVPRGVQAATRLLAVLIAGGIQLYLMHVVSACELWSSAVFQIASNLAQPLRCIPFVLFMLPWARLGATLVRKLSKAEAPVWRSPSARRYIWLCGRLWARSTNSASSSLAASRSFC
jgi:hypothetical protein